MKIISNKRINHVLAILLCVALSLVLFSVFLDLKLNPILKIIIPFIFGLSVAFGDRKIIPHHNFGILSFLGKKVKDKNGNDVLLDKGIYFTFFIFNIKVEKIKNPKE